MKVENCLPRCSCREKVQKACEKRNFKRTGLKFKAKPKLASKVAGTVRCGPIVNQKGIGIDHSDTFCSSRRLVFFILIFLDNFLKSEFNSVISKKGSNEGGVAIAVSSFIGNQSPVDP